MFNLGSTGGSTGGGNPVDEDIIILGDDSSSSEDSSPVIINTTTPVVVNGVASLDNTVGAVDTSSLRNFLDEAQTPTLHINSLHINDEVNPDIPVQALDTPAKEVLPKIAPETESLLNPFPEIAPETEMPILDIGEDTPAKEVLPKIAPESESLLDPFQEIAPETEMSILDIGEDTPAKEMLPKIAPEAESLLDPFQEIAPETEMPILDIGEDTPAKEAGALDMIAILSATIQELVVRQNVIAGIKLGQLAKIDALNEQIKELRSQVAGLKDEIKDIDEEDINIANNVLTLESMKAGKSVICTQVENKASEGDDILPHKKGVKSKRLIA